MNEEMIVWLRERARAEGDESIVRACGRALEGDAVAMAMVEETLENWVVRACPETRDQRPETRD